MAKKPTVKVDAEVKMFSVPSFYAEEVVVGKSERNQIIRLTFLEARRNPLNSDEIQYAERVDVVIPVLCAKGVAEYLLKLCEPQQD